MATISAIEILVMDGDMPPSQNLCLVGFAADLGNSTVQRLLRSGPFAFLGLGKSIDCETDLVRKLSVLTETLVDAHSLWTLAFV